MTSAAHLIKIAENELGYKEGRHNASKYGKWFGLPNSAWCDMFVSWCADQAGLSKVVGKYAWTPSHAAWFRKRKQWGSKPRRGAIVFFSLNGADRINHVGIVVEVLKDGRIRTIEGNAGDRVKFVHRRTGIVGYGYPQYPAGTPKPAPKVSVPKFPLPAGWWFGPASKDRRSITGRTGPAEYRAGLKLWQERMVKRGWGAMLGKPSGTYTGKTRAVAEAFQRQKGLTVDGEIGINTWKAAWTTPVTPD